MTGASAGTGRHQFWNPNIMTDTASADAQRLIDNCLVDAHFPEFPEHFLGKVRDAYDLPDGRRSTPNTYSQTCYSPTLRRLNYIGLGPSKKLQGPDN